MMDWLDLATKIGGSGYFKDLSLVFILIGAFRSHLKKIETSVDGVRSELHDLKGVFRDQNKRLANVEGTLEAHKFELYEINLDLKTIKKGVTNGTT